MILKPKPFVYLASPYTHGSASLNANFQAEIYRMLVRDGIVTPFAPLLAHYVPGQELLTYEQWFDHVTDVLKRCDALYTFDVDLEFPGGEEDYVSNISSGRDKEVRMMEELGRPVFRDLDELYLWVELNFGDGK